MKCVKKSCCFDQYHDTYSCDKDNFFNNIRFVNKTDKKYDPNKKYQCESAITWTKDLYIKFQIAETYAFLPREAVTRFLMSCSDCQKRMHMGTENSTSNNDSVYSNAVSNVNEHDLDPPIIDFSVPITQTYLNHMRQRGYISPQDGYDEVRAEPNSGTVCHSSQYFSHLTYPQRKIPWATFCFTTTFISIFAWYFACCSSTNNSQVTMYNQNNTLLIRKKHNNHILICRAYRQPYYNEQP